MVVARRLTNAPQKCGALLFCWRVGSSLLEQMRHVKERRGLRAYTLNPTATPNGYDAKHCFLLTGTGALISGGTTSYTTA